MKQVLSILLLFNSYFLMAQIPVYNTQDDTVMYFTNSTVLSKNKKEIYNTKGNIIFKANSTNYKDIVYTLALDSFNQKKEAKIYNKKGAPTNFSIKQNTFYYELNDTKYSIASLVKNENTYALYNNLNDSLLVYFLDTDVNKGVIFGIFNVVFNDFKLEKQLYNSLQQNTGLPENYGRISPVFGNGFAWIWDGKYLYPEGVNLNHAMVWEFNGEKLKPKNYPRTQEEWRWDGESLKPYWGGNPQGLWTWQNGVLRQIWNNNYKNEYFIDENVIRKRFGNYGENEWEMQGNIPLPIITAIVLGYVFR